jgi:hypothetical protein
MPKVNFMFVRTATVTETGGVEIEVENETDWDEIEEKLRERKFSAFLTSTRIYENENWEFDDLEPMGDDDDEVA